MASRAPGAAQTPKIDDFRPAQKSCIKNSSESTPSSTVKSAKAAVGRWMGGSSGLGGGQAGSALPHRADPGYLKAVCPQIVGSVFGRFSAKLGPQTPLDRRGSSCSAGCTKNQPGRPILRPFHGANKFRPDCLQVPSLRRPENEALKHHHERTYRGAASAGTPILAVHWGEIRIRN